MLCDCLGNMMRVKLSRMVDGRRVETGEVVRICDRCALKMSEDDYQKWVNKPIQPTDTGG